MSWQATPVPQQIQWLQQEPNAAHILNNQQFLECAQAHMEWLDAEALRAELPNPHNTIPDAWLKDGDLQTFVDVVSWWPKNAKGMPAPNLFSMILSIPMGQHKTFIEHLEFLQERVRKWCKHNRIDPNNPNETATEKALRLNRERVARHRLRHMSDSDDPELQPLLTAAKTAELNASQGRKWLAGAIRQAKLECSKAIADAKALRESQIINHTAAVAAAELAAANAKAALDAYTSNK